MKKNFIVYFCLFIVLILSSCEMYSTSISPTAMIIPTETVVTPTYVINTPTYMPEKTESIVTPGGDKMNNNCRLIVNGKDITSENYVMMTQDNVYLPFTAILEALGAEVFWQSDTTAKISYDGKKYLLTTADCSLIEEGEDFNFLLIPPGGPHRYWTIENEFIVDRTMMQSVFILMEKNINVRFSSKEKVVRVFYRSAD